MCRLPCHDRLRRMHELSLCRAIANTVERGADGRRVKLVTLRIGRLRQVVPETLGFYCGFVSQGTLCEDAVLEQEDVAVLVHCGDCEREWDRGRGARMH